MVSGNENFVPEYINLSISPVKCSHCTLRNEKNHFSTISRFGIFRCNWTSCYGMKLHLFFTDEKFFIMAAMCDQVVN